MDPDVFTKKNKWISSEYRDGFKIQINENTPIFNPKLRQLNIKITSQASKWIQNLNLESCTVTHRNAEMH